MSSRSCVSPKRAGAHDAAAPSRSALSAPSPAAALPNVAELAAAVAQRLDPSTARLQARADAAEGRLAAVTQQLKARDALLGAVRRNTSKKATMAFRQGVQQERKGTKQNRIAKRQSKKARAAHQGRARRATAEFFSSMRMPPPPPRAAAHAPPPPPPPRPPLAAAEAKARARRAARFGTGSR